MISRPADSSTYNEMDTQQNKKTDWKKEKPVLWNTVGLFFYARKHLKSNLLYASSLICNIVPHLMLIFLKIDAQVTQSKYENTFGGNPFEHERLF